MKRLVCLVLAPLAILLSSTSSADAWYLGKWGILPVFPRYHYTVGYTPYSCAYVPQYVYWAPPVQYVQCTQAVPQTPRVGWAQPMQAPPSRSTNEPPVQSPKAKAPTISESRSHGGNYTAVSNPTELCRVGFWNLTGRDVNLLINGHPFVVPRDRSLTFEVARRFACQIDQQEAKSVEVPGGDKTHEIVIR